jgi:anaerobic magnesium-protoporphyrin IX monomethyl ester cyclase
MNTNDVSSNGSQNPNGSGERLDATFLGRDTTMTGLGKLAKVTCGPVPKDPHPKDFRVLLVYPNYMFVNLLPTNIGILTACLRQNGFHVELFDTTFYRTAEKSLDEIRVEHLQLRKFSLSDFGVHPKETDCLQDFRKKVLEYKPHLIAVTAVEDTYPQGLALLETVRDTGIPTIVGGVFPTLAPETAIRDDLVDMVCVGEGEHALVELCTRMHERKDFHTVQNLWVKKNGKIVRNTMRPPIHMDDVPHSDWSLFEKERFYRPMQGKIFRMLPVETDRGCPYTCRFCEAPSLVNLYKKNTGSYYFRRKSWDRVKEEFDLYIAKYNAQYIYFNAETFLAMTNEEFDQFIDMYRHIRLPFWMQTRVETITPERLKALEDVNCNRISIGLEHGDENFRRTIIGKGFSNQRLKDVFKLLNNCSIPVTVNNIIGFPGETRELVFQTIEINRHLASDSVNCYYFTPYRGTPLRDLALEKGYITEDTKTSTPIMGSVLNMPQLTREEILGLVRTFCLYVKFPKEEWPMIRIAEKFDEEGNAMFEKLSGLYYERFFDHDFKYAKKACFSTQIYKSPTEDVPQ